jgi:hypothetical protein
MDTHKQQIAIAVACGWHKHDCGDCLCWKLGTELMGITCSVYDLPDYLNDLNSMHKAEKMLTLEQHSYYRENLAMVVGFTDISPTGGRAYVSATAIQRAEAFLRTLGIWEETNNDYNNIK